MEYFAWKKQPFPENLVTAKALDWHNLGCNICNHPEVAKAQNPG